MKRTRLRAPFSPMGRLAAQYAGVGVTVAALSAFLGFYAAAFIMADSCYPELGVGTIQAIHRQLFTSLPLNAAVYLAAVSLLYWVFAKGQLRQAAELARKEGKRESGC